MKQQALKIILLLSAFLFCPLSPAFSADATPAPKAAAAPPGLKEIELTIALRDLWDGHIFWVRNVVVATHYHDAKAAKAAEDQVVQNAKNIGDAIAGFYGKEAGDKLFKLLAGHYGAVKDYMNASFKGDKKAETAATDKATKNAEEIASFLSSANPYLPKDVLFSLLAAHYGHHVTQIDNVAAKDFAAEAHNWDAMLKHINGVADTLAGALAKQFPEKMK
ncbi:MAG: hypothetical protein ACM3JK_01410 [Betaproteobacteria bacterium]